MAKKPARPMIREDIMPSEYGPAIEPKRPRPRQMVPEDITPSEYGPPSYKKGGKVMSYCKGGKVISSRSY